MVDESGELLGGKRAAIQYAYETSVRIWSYFLPK